MVGRRGPYSTSDAHQKPGLRQLRLPVTAAFGSRCPTPEPTPCRGGMAISQGRAGPRAFLFTWTREGRVEPVGVPFCRVSRAWQKETTWAVPGFSQPCEFPSHSCSSCQGGAGGTTLWGGDSGMLWLLHPLAWGPWVSLRA